MSNTSPRHKREITYTLTEVLELPPYLLLISPLWVLTTLNNFKEMKYSQYIRTLQVIGYWQEE